MNNKLINLFKVICLSVFWIGCSDDDSVQQVTVNFTNREAGISSSAPSADVGITFSRAAPGSGEIQLAITSDDLTYGSEADFFTNPEAVNNIIILPYAAGEESVSFTITAGPALNIQANQTITIALQDSNSDLIVGENVSLTVTFSENYVAPSGTIELDAGGETFVKQAFVDLSKLKQTTVNKHTWDLGFSTGAGAHYVALNSSAYTMARVIDKSDLNAVTAQDTLDFGYEMQIPPPNYDPSVGAIEWADTPDGNLETTAIGAINASNAENKVFIIKRDGDRNWKKIRVLQNGDNYTLQYADIAATSFETAEITKDENYNFIFFDLDDGAVNVEPTKDSWDIMYSTYTESLNLGGPGMDIPYGFKDYITINRYNTKIGMVMNDEKAYADFSSEDIASVDFNTAIDALGENWRDGGGPGSAPSLYEDRYFVLEDSEGSVFKIKFTRLTSTEGERGYPEFTFEIVR